MKKLIKTILAVILCMTLIGSTVMASNSYPDVAETDWYYSTVMDATEQSIITGFGDGTFKPAEPLTRGQFAVILYRIEGEPPVHNQITFQDVPADSYYYDAINWAELYQIAMGYDYNIYRPDQSISREQLATMLWRYECGKSNGTYWDTDAIDRYPDAGKVSPYAEDAVAWAVYHGIITGDNGYLNPQGNASRAEAVTMVMRYLK